jgi:ATP-dependent protease ClpP protease subunit
MTNKINTELPYYIDDVSITALIDKIEEDSEHQDSELSWNSLGGSVYAGQKFADFLNSLDIKIEANVTGIAASMGAALLPFFNRVKGAEQSDIMLHSASGGGASIKHTNQFLYEALAKKINETIFETITGKKLKDVMLAEGENRIDVWFTGKDAKKMGLFDEVYSLLDQKAASLTFTNTKLGYNLPENIKIKYNQIKNPNMETKDLTAAKLQAENLELYNSIVAVGKASEQKRVSSIMKYAAFDVKKAEELIKSGEEIKLDDVEYFIEKKFSASKIAELEEGSPKNIDPAKVTGSKEEDEKEAALKELREQIGTDFTTKK